MVFALVQMVSYATAQDTVLVSCWSGKNSEIYRSRNVKGPVISSTTGERAYVTVSASATGGSCSNVTKLLVAPQAGEFRKVFEARPIKAHDGNGMRLIGWNRSGTKLMAELGRFTYGTDVGMDREIVVYETIAKKVSHIDVEAVLAKYFGADCAFEFETRAWHEPDGAVVAAGEYKDVEGNNVKSCVQRTTRLIVNLSTGAVTVVPGR